MPIANCFIKNKQISQSDLENLAEDWAKELQVSIKDITITVFSNFTQAGNKFEIMVNLFLPSLWPQDSIENIQKNLLKLLMKYFKVSSDEIFILTSIIKSGHVVENGETLEW